MAMWKSVIITFVVATLLSLQTSVYATNWRSPPPPPDYEGPLELAAVYFLRDRTYTAVKAFVDRRNDAVSKFLEEHCPTSGGRRLSTFNTTICFETSTYLVHTKPSCLPKEAFVTYGDAGVRYTFNNAQDYLKLQDYIYKTEENLENGRGHHAYQVWGRKSGY